MRGTGCTSPVDKLAGAHPRAIVHRPDGKMLETFRYWCVALPGMNVDRLPQHKEAVGGTRLRVLLGGYAISGRVAELRFGALPAATRERLEGEADLAVLDRWFAAVARATTLASVIW